MACRGRLPTTYPIQPAKRVITVWTQGECFVVGFARLVRAAGADGGVGEALDDRTRVVRRLPVAEISLRVDGFAQECERAIVIAASAGGRPFQLARVDLEHADRVTEVPVA